VDIPVEAFSATHKSKGINFAVESKFDVSAVEKAAEVLRGLYHDAGQEVRVEYAVAEIPLHALEVSFEIIQLCTCQ
jgi:hypothetical protein